MDIIDEKIKDVTRLLVEYQKAINDFKEIYPGFVNPLGYSSEPVFAVGSKEDIVVDALEAYKMMLRLRTGNMNYLIEQSRTRIRGDTLSPGI